MSEVYPQFAAWLHSLTSTDVVAAIIVVAVAVYLAFGRLE